MYSVSRMLQSVSYRLPLYMLIVLTMAVDCYERLIPLVQTVLQQHELWKLTEADSSSLVDSILSSSERLSVICESRQQQHLWGCLTEQRFPDLPSRLLYKQRKSMETLLEGMQQTMQVAETASLQTLDFYFGVIVCTLKQLQSLG